MEKAKKVLLSLLVLAGGAGVTYAGVAWLIPVIVFIGLGILFVGVFMLGGALEFDFNDYYLGLRDDGSWSYKELNKNLAMAQTIAREIESNRDEEDDVD